MAPTVVIPDRPQAPVTVGISHCLTGAQVRYDGSGAHTACPHAALDGLFTFKSFCPEVGIGMTVPRQPIRLIGTADTYRVVTVHDSSVDKTDQLAAFARGQIATIERLAAFIFMHNSPSCGLMDVKVYAHEHAPPRRQASGIFARTVSGALPELPVEDAGQLFSATMRESFVARTYTYAHWQTIAGDISEAR